MRVLICSQEASALLSLLAPLQLTIDSCETLAAMPDVLAHDVGALLIAEEALGADAEWLRARLQSSIPIIVLASSDAQSPAAFTLDGAVMVERPFTSRSLCSCLTALVARGPSESVQGSRSAGELALLQSQRMDAVGSLTGGIAHDYNNMLTGIIGALDIMKRRVASGRLEGLERFIKAASVSADRASALTQRLLTFSLRQPLDRRPVVVDSLVGTLELLIRRTINESTSLQIDYHHDCAVVLTDARQLENAILDLAVNARDAMPGGGQLKLHTSLIDLTAANVTALPDLLPGRYLIIAFSDTGSGMSNETLEKVFDPFFTTKPEGQGRGLGLSLVHGFARQSGGQATIDSEPGVGTTVRLFLPVADNATGHQAVAVAQRKAGYRILLVESDSAERLLVCEVLSDMGGETVNATEPQAAIDLLASDAPFDLLVVDATLPGMRGETLVEIALGHRPGLPVLLIANDTDTAGIAVAPHIRVIGKPFSLRELGEVLGELLPASV